MCVCVCVCVCVCHCVCKMGVHTHTHTHVISSVTRPKHKRERDIERETETDKNLASDYILSNYFINRNPEHISMDIATFLIKMSKYFCVHICHLCITSICAKQ